MLHGLFIAGLIYACYQIIKEALEPVIPAENWGNKDLIHKDRMDGMSEKEILKNAEKGKYIVVEKYPEPHRDPKDGKIIIENNLLYKEDLRKYGAVQTHQWVKQGKYNLTSEELEKEHERVNKEMEKLYGLVRKNRKF